MAINDVTRSGLLDDLHINSKQPAKEEKKNELDQDAFLQLMITQMNNQNPLEPQKNSEFVAQLAQFSSVEGLEKLNGQVEQMVGSLQSSQALQASALVGRSVTIESRSAPLAAGGQIKGSVAVPNSTPGLTLNIYDPAGRLVSRQDLGSQAPGEVSFTWDGKDSQGADAPPGHYIFEAVGITDGEAAAYTTYLPANVNSVTLGANNSMILNVDGAGEIRMSDVKEIL